MKRKLKKGIAILLVFAMLFSLMPATAFAADSRIVVKDIAANLSGDITPEYGELAEDPAFTVTKGQPAYFTMGGWRKEAGDDWILVAYNDYFSEGTYRYEVQVRIDDEDAKTHVLSGNNDVTVMVNGERWETIQDVRAGGGDDGYSYMVVASKEFNVTAPENLALTFHDSSVFDIGKSFKGHEIQSYFVAQNAEGGTKPYTFSKVSGPAWISVSAAGEISGTPDAVGENEDLVVQVTDSKDAEATITIKVAETVLSSSDREKIYTFEAKSLTGDITPEYGSSGAEDPKFTVIEGQPAYLSDTMGYYIKKVGDDWIDINVNDTIDEGTYRYKVQLRIDGDKGGEEYVLPQAVITVTVDGEEWEVVYPVATVDKTSWVWVMSPEFTVTKPVIQAIKINGITAPVAGETADVSGITTANKGITLGEVQWCKPGRDSKIPMGESDKFELGKTYYLVIPYTVSEDYTVSESAEVLHDLTGGTAKHTASVKTIVIEYTVPKAYTVTVETDGHGTASANVAKAAKGTTVTLTATPDEGYELDKWEIIEDGKEPFKLPGNSFTMPEHDVVLKASFKEKATVTTIDTINITGITAPVADKSPVTDGITTDTTGVTLKTIQWEKTGGVSMGSSEKFEVGQTYTLYISYEPQSGYEISNTVTVTSDLENSSLTANSDRVNIQYTVPEAATYIVSVIDGTARQVDPASDEYATTIETKAGNRILLKADEKEGMVFTGWSGLDGITLYGDGTTAEYATLQFFMPEKNVTVKANYIDESSDKVIKNINITGITTPLAGASPKVDGITINTENVRLSRADWTHEGRYLGFVDTFEKGKQYCLYVSLKLDEGYSVANDVTITADIDYDNAFVRDNVVYIYYTVKEDAPASYTVTVENDGNGTASADVTKAKEGDTVTLTATADSGYKFKEWKVTSAPDGTIVTIADGKFTMPAGAVTVKAVFEKDDTPVTKYTVSYDSNGGSAVTAQIIEAGQKATKPADPTKADYVFKGWTLNGADYDFTTPVTGNIKLVAKWEAVHTHTYAGEWSKDATHHWYASTCGHDVVDAKAEHTPDRAEATETEAITCTECGYVMAPALGHTHTYATEWSKDATHHWYASTCGHDVVNAKAEHTPDRAEATETEAITCTECGYVMAPALGHTHTYASEWSKDATHHWYASTCGHDVVNAKAEHDYGSDRVCDICGYTKPSSGSSSGGGFSGVYNYPVTVEDTADAKVTASEDYASKGEKVVITVTPAAGKAVDEVIVTDKDGEVIPVTKTADNEYTFTMPASKVMVAVAMEDADYGLRIVMQINNKNILVNGVTKVNDVAPVIVGDRTLVPIRVVTELLGGTADWDNDTRTVTLKIDGKTMNMTIGKEIPGFGTSAVIMNDRTYVPVRYVMEMLGAEVEWIDATRQIIIEK